MGRKSDLCCRNLCCDHYGIPEPRSRKVNEPCIHCGSPRVEAIA